MLLLQKQTVYVNTKQMDENFISILLADVKIYEFCKSQKLSAHNLQAGMTSSSAANHTLLHARPPGSSTQMHRSTQQHNSLQRFIPHCHQLTQLYVPHKRSVPLQWPFSRNNAANMLQDIDSKPTPDINTFRTASDHSTQ